MIRAAIALLSLPLLLPLQVYGRQAETSGKVSNFNGVWRAVPDKDAPREGTTLRWIPRPDQIPAFTPEYAARFKKTQVSRESGSEETEPVTRCLPPGMPYIMGAEYGLEVVQAPDKIAFFSEWMDAYRRIYLDGRKPPKDFDASYNGFSIGHWEGDTLVAETTNLRDDTVLDKFGSPHSDATRIVERLRVTGPDSFEDKVTVYDSKAFTKPWEYVQAYRRAKPDDDMLRENTCTESLKVAK